MRTALHGLVLPFVEMETSVTTNNDGSKVKIQSQQNMSGNFLATYAEKFTYEDGWDGGDVSYAYELSFGNAYAYQKAVTENGKKYYVSVMFTGLEQTSGSEQINISKTGCFYLEASDPYEYEYPAAFISAWMGQEFGTTIVPPAFEAEYYSLDSEGVLIGYSERNLEESYKSVLLSSGNFTIDSARNDDGFLIARPTDGSYIMLFKYDSTNKIMILQVMENNGWNASKINAFYRKYNQTPLEFPALNIDGASYKFEEDDYNEQYAGAGRLSGVHATYTISKTGLTAAPLANYARDLRAAGYAVNSLSPDNDQYILMKAIADGVLYTAHVTYNATPIGGGKPQIVVDFYASGLEMDGLLANWPATQLSTFFGSDITDALPAYTGIQCGFKFQTSGDAAVITINVDSQASATIKNDYIALLSEFTENSGKYTSKNNQYYVRVNDPQGYGYYDVFEIRIDKISAPVATPWPAEDIATAIGEITTFNPTTETLPVLDVSAATSCYVGYKEGTYFELVIGGLASSANDFEAVFKNNGWVYDQYYNFINTGDASTTMVGGLVSPSRKLVVHFLINGNELVIYVKSYYEPVITVAGLGGDWNYNHSLVFFESADDAEEIARGDYIKQYKAEFDVAANDEFKVTNGVDWYGFNALEANNKFVAGEGDRDPNIKALEKGSVTLYFKIKENNVVSIYIAFEADSSGSGSGEQPQLTPWPEDAINAYFGSAFDFVPEIKIAGASFSVLDTYEFEQGREFIIEATGDGIAALLEAAINDCLITQYGYHLDDEEYVSTCENYPIYAFDVINDDTIYVYIVQAYDIHSWEYVKAAFEDDQVGITLPDLQVDGAISYAYNGSIDITFADDANMQNMYSAVCIKLESDGYHYSQRFMGFVNTTTDLCFRVQFSDSDEHTVSVVCSEQAFEDDEGYGIVIIGYDNEGNYYYVIDDTLIGVDNPANENEVMVLSVEFEAGTKFYIYDYDNETHFNPRLNGASLGESFNEYLEYNEATGEYLVKKNFVGDVYILIEYGNDSVYIGFVNP